MKIPKKYFSLVFGATVTFLVGIFVSFVVAYSQFGFGPDFLQKYAEIFVTAFVVAFPVGALLGPVAEKIAKAVVE